jgi:hypothetical protein
MVHIVISGVEVQLIKFMSCSLDFGLLFFHSNLFSVVPQVYLLEVGLAALVSYGRFFPVNELVLV